MKIWLKNATDVDTSEIAKKNDLASLSKLTDVGNNDVVLKTEYDKLF